MPCLEWRWRSALALLVGVTAGLLAEPASALPPCLAGSELVSTYSAEELVLQARLARSRNEIGDGLLAYQHDGGVYLPTLDVFLHLELPLPSTAMLAEVGCTVAPDDAYLETSMLEKLLAATLELDTAAMRLSIKAAQMFPVEQRRQREKSWQQLSRRQAALSNPQAEFIASPHVWFEAPSATLTVFSGVQESGDSSNSFSLRGAGDLLRMSSQYLVSGDDQQGLRNATGVLERYDPAAGLLGFASARSVQLGDVSGISDSLLTVGSSGRGISVGNSVRGSRGAFGQTVLSGLLPEGWSVELLRGGELIAVQTQAVDGRYEFLDVELEFGSNDFTLNFFGPAGERRTEVVSESVAQSSARAGEWQYQAVARQTSRGLDGRMRTDVAGLRDLGDWLQSRARFGWSRWLEQDFGLDVFRDGSTNVTERFGSTGMIGRWGQWQAQARGLHALDQEQTAWELGLSGRALGGTFFARHSDFSGLDSERTRQGGTGLLLRNSQLRWTQSLDVLYPGLITSLQGVQGAREDRLLTRDLRARVTLPVSGWLVSNETSQRRLSGPVDVLSTSNLLRLRRQFGGWGLRLDVRNQLKPDSELSTALLNLDYRYSRTLRLRSSARYDASVDVQEYSAGANYLARWATIGADLSHQSRDGWRLSANLSVSFSADPDGGLLWGRESYSNRGRISLQAFEDLDGDGLQSADEPLVEGFRPSARSGRPTTDFAALSPHQTTTVRVHAPRDVSPFLTAQKDEFNVLPRPGHHQQVLLPLRQTGEAEGAVFRTTSSGAPRPLAGLRVQASDQQGKLWGEIRTAYDGIFVLDRLPLGRYRLHIAADDLARLGMESAEQQIEVTVPGDVVQVGTLLLRSPVDIAEAKVPPALAAGAQVATSPAPPTETWNLVLGGYTSPTSAAAALQEHLERAGKLPLNVLPAPLHGLFWVVAGPYSSRQEAWRAKADIERRLGIDGFWLSPPSDPSK